MSFIAVEYGRFFQRNTGAGYALVGVIHTKQTPFTEGCEHLACHQHGILLLDPQPITPADTLHRLDYDNSTLGVMLNLPIWKATTDRAFFTLRTLPLPGGAHLIYSAKATAFFDAPAQHDAFFTLAAGQLRPLSPPLDTRGCTLDSIVRAPIWALNAEDDAAGRLGSVEPASTPLLRVQNQVYAAFLRVKQEGGCLADTRAQLAAHASRLDAILRDPVYCAYLLTRADTAPLEVKRFTPSSQTLNRQDALAVLVSALNGPTPTAHGAGVTL